MQAQIMSRLIRVSCVVAVMLALMAPIVADATNTPTRQDRPVPVWDHAPQPIPCGGKEVVTFTPGTGQSAIARYDDTTRKVVTVVIFFDSGRVEEDGRAFRYHYTTTTAGLWWEIHSADVTVTAQVGPCNTGPGGIGGGPPRIPPTATRVPPTATPRPPTATPIIWEYQRVVPCGTDPRFDYNPAYGLPVIRGDRTPSGQLVVFTDTQRIEGPGHALRYLIRTDGKPNCVLKFALHSNYVDVSAGPLENDE